MKTGLAVLPKSDTIRRKGPHRYLIPVTHCADAWRSMLQRFLMRDDVWKGFEAKKDGDGDDTYAFTA